MKIIRVFSPKVISVLLNLYPGPWTLINCENNTLFTNPGVQERKTGQQLKQQKLSAAVPSWVDGTVTEAEVHQQNKNENEMR